MVRLGCLMRSRQTVTFIRTHAAQTRGEDMSLTAAAGGFVVFLLSMPVIQGQDGWGVTYTSNKICALTGSTVNISCTISYPSRIHDHDTTVEKMFWLAIKGYYRKVDLSADSDYASRVEYHFHEGKKCTLTISDLRKSDSAEYQFRFTTNQLTGQYTGSPGVALSVTDLQVREIKLTGYQGLWTAELKCHSSCSLPDDSSYIWYKNGQKLQGETPYFSGNFYDSDSFSCALKGHEDFPSPSVCVRGRSCHKVTYFVRNICAFKGFSVDINCAYSSSYITTKFWFSPERSHRWSNSSRPEDVSKDSQVAGRVQVFDRYTGHSTLRIRDLTESDSAEYRFKFTTGSFEWRSSLPGTTLTVTDPVLQVLKFNYHRTLLHCHSSCPVPYDHSYVWFKDGKWIEEQTAYFFHYADSSASYACALKGHEDFHSPLVCIYDQTCNRVTYADRHICASKGSSVDISCTYSSGGTITSKFWFRHHAWLNPSESEDVSKDAGRVQVLETERGRSTLRIRDLTESDSAEYRFKFTAGSFEWRSSLPGTTLTVTALQVQVTRKNVHESHTEAELKCHSSCTSAGRLSYVWFKNGKKITREESLTYKDHFYPGDVIFCALKAHETHGSPSLYALKRPSVSVSPADIMENSSVTLTCSSGSNSTANYTWYKKGVNLKPLGDEAQLVFSSIQSSDSGQYYCAAENELGGRTSGYIAINVKYAPKLPSVSVSPPGGEIVEGSSVTLTCSSDANPAANYSWYKDNQTLVQGAAGRYHFPSISSEDRRNYHCKSENQYGQLHSSPVFIDVKYAPKLPSVSVSPPAGEIVEGSSVTLTCSSDANPAANYTWYKENEDAAKASAQNFTITDFRHEHSGNYYCEAQNTRGRHNSTLHVIAVAGAWKSAAAGTTTVVFLVILIILCASIVIRQMKASKQPPQSSGRPDNKERRQADEQDDEQDDLHYASVKFSKNNTEALYSNIRAAGHNGNEDGSSEYAAVAFRGHTTSRSEEAEEEVAAIYSTIITS